MRGEWGEIMRGRVGESGGERVGGESGGERVRGNRVVNGDNIWVIREY